MAIRRIRPIADGTVGEPGHQTEVDHPEPAVGQSLKLPGWGSACSTPAAGTGEEKPHVAHRDGVALVGRQGRTRDSGTPSTHSLTRTVDALARTCGTKNSAWPAKPSAACCWAEASSV